MMTLVRAFLSGQQRLCTRIDRRLSPLYRLDGGNDFAGDLVPRHLRHGLKIYDVGGGKQPFLEPVRKEELRATVIGLDISEHELALAPDGAYDDRIVADIAGYRGAADGDLVLCMALLEHVRDMDGAFESIASLLRPEGKALLFVPSRNAAFARLNLVLPSRLKRWILFTIFPGAQVGHGFEAFYERCTPMEFRFLASIHGFEVLEERLYFRSNYFTFFAPLYAVWHLWVRAYRALSPVQSAETFSLVLRKR